MNTEPFPRYVGKMKKAAFFLEKKEKVCNFALIDRNGHCPMSDTPCWFCMQRTLPDNNSIRYLHGKIS